MVRTLASNVKAIGGKTPKKAAAVGGGGNRSSSSGSASKPKSGSSKSSGVSWRSIPITKQDIPTWQKPITNFFPPKDREDGATTSQQTSEEAGASTSHAMHEDDVMYENIDPNCSSSSVQENNTDDTNKVDKIGETQLTDDTEIIDSEVTSNNMAL